MASSIGVCETADMVANLRLVPGMLSANLRSSIEDCPVTNVRPGSLRGTLGSRRRWQQLVSWEKLAKDFRRTI